MDDPPPFDVETLARLAGLELPPECVAGVAENLALLAEHARRLAPDAP